MSKRVAVPRIVLASLFAALAASFLLAGPVRAAGTPADSAAAKPAAGATAKPKKTKTPKTPKPEPSLEDQRAADGLWMKRSNWLALRAGYAKATGDRAGNGFGGYGMAYTRMLTNRWALTGAVHHELLGKLGAASEIAVPFTLEFDRHFRWKTAFRPYVGLGGGYYFHKYYRTAGYDTGSPGSGVHVSVGGNVPVDDHHLLGIDTRISFLSTTDGAVNPVFGTAKSSETLWSIKLNWAFAY